MAPAAAQQQAEAVILPAIPTIVKAATEPHAKAPALAELAVMAETANKVFAKKFRRD